MEVTDYLKDPNIFDFISKSSPEHLWEKYYLLKPGDTFVEAGAFWCRYGMKASFKVGSTGRVILIEPNPCNIPVIKAVIKRMNLENVMLVEMAVWDKTDELDFVVNGGASKIEGCNELEGSKVTCGTAKVQADTLDNILSSLNIDKVDLLSCDVEGAEVQLMKGTHKYFNEKRILNVALGAYHMPVNISKIIMKHIESMDFKNVKYEDGVVYGSNY